MARPSFTQYMDEVFAPFIHNSGLSHLRGRLKTCDLDESIKDDQLERIKKLKIPETDLLFVGSHSFIARLQCEGDKYLLVSIEHLSRDEVEKFNDFMVSEGLISHRLEESFFLHLRYYLRDFYKLKKEYRTQAASSDVIDVVVPNYPGHSIEDLIDCYENISVLKIPADSVYYGSSIWYAAVMLASNFDVFRSPLVSAALAVKLGNLAKHERFPIDNLYVALTAIHWKYTFFELYKCLEKIYYLPWHFKLKSELGSRMSAANLAKICQVTIKWRAKEADSIRGLFELADNSIFGDLICKNVAFRSLGRSPISRPAFGRRVYRIRNILVHQQDYEDDDDAENIKIDDSDWPQIIEFMCDLIDNLYLTYNDDLES